MNEQPITSFSVILGRMMWMIVGPLILLFVTYNIANKGGGWATPSDIAFFAVLGLMVLGRVVEYRGGHAQKADGTPATAGDLRRYFLGLGVAALSVWVLANLLGNVWLER